MIYVDDKERAILNECQRHPGVSEYLIQKATGINKPTLSVYIREMSSEGLIRRHGAGYALAEELREDEEPAYENCCKRSGA